MGNRAVLQFGTEKDALGIYLHWNGGRDSVEGFLKAARKLNIRRDCDYGAARLVQIISNFFGGKLCVGVQIAKHLDTHNQNNGTYVIKDLQIVDRLYFDGDEQMNKEKTKEVFEECIKANEPVFKRDSTWKIGV